jgi:hypothetical protein
MKKLTRAKHAFKGGGVEREDQRVLRRQHRSCSNASCHVVEMQQEIVYQEQRQVSQSVSVPVREGSRQCHESCRPCEMRAGAARQHDTSDSAVRYK